jgi:hypothetical protein
MGETNRHRIGSLDNAALETMNKTHHFKNDSKMSIQEGALEKHSPASILQRNTLNLRPFDAFGKLLNRDAAMGVKSIHQTIQPQISSDVVLGFRSSNVSVDVITPEIPDAMDRIRKRNTAKKNDKVKQMKKMEDYLEVAKEQVLSSYKIKSIL